MKRLLAIVALTALSTHAAVAQDRTLAGEHGTLGGFGGPTLTYTRIAGKDAVLLGARGALLMNSTVAMGISIAGWSNDLVRGSDGNHHKLGLGYGGFDLEYIDHPHSVAHFALQLTIGGGTATQDNSLFDNDDRKRTFFLSEPGVAIEVNVLKAFRIGAGVTYRFVNGIDLPAFKDEDFRGMSGRVTFKFGKFS